MTFFEAIDHEIYYNDEGITVSRDSGRQKAIWFMVLYLSSRLRCDEEELEVNGFATTRGPGRLWKAAEKDNNTLLSLQALVSL